MFLKRRRMSSIRMIQHVFKSFVVITYNCWISDQQPPKLLIISSTFYTIISFARTCFSLVLFKFTNQLKRAINPTEPTNTCVPTCRYIRPYPTDYISQLIAKTYHHFLIKKCYTARNMCAISGGHGLFRPYRLFHPALHYQFCFGNGVCPTSGGGFLQPISYSHTCARK